MLSEAKRRAANGRVYDPLIARFLSPDPFVQAPNMALSFNRYAYCLNNPLIYTDPTGYKWYEPWTWSLERGWDNFWEGMDNFAKWADKTDWFPSSGYISSNNFYTSKDTPINITYWFFDSEGLMDFDILADVNMMDFVLGDLEPICNTVKSSFIDLSGERMRINGKYVNSYGDATNNYSTYTLHAKSDKRFYYEQSSFDLNKPWVILKPVIDYYLWRFYPSAPDIWIVHPSILIKDLRYNKQDMTL